MPPVIVLGFQSSAAEDVGHEALWLAFGEQGVRQELCSVSSECLRASLEHPQSETLLLIDLTASPPSNCGLFHFVRTQTQALRCTRSV